MLLSDVDPLVCVNISVVFAQHPNHLSVPVTKSRAYIQYGFYFPLLKAERFAKS